MTGNVQKRNGAWRVVLELGEQAALRCPTCRRRYWSDDDQARTCDAAHGELEEVVARRQEMLPAKYETKKDAQRALRKALDERERGDYVPAIDLTVAEYLKTRWLPSLDAEELSEATPEAYRMHVGRIVPLVGKIPLQELTRNDVAVMAARMAKEKSSKTGRPLSPATRSGALGVLQHALDDALESGLLRSNPAAKVKKPKVRRPELHTWSGAELATFLQATRQDRLGPLWHLLALTGMRRGEALGLRWSDVDFEHGRLELQRQRKIVRYAVLEGALKTGPRAVALDAETVDALRRQSQQQLDDAAAWKTGWVGEGHVFTREDGEPWHPDRVRVLFQEAIKAAKAPRIRMHDLRHTWATLALRAGVHPKVVQERLGHANIRITMDTYSHCLPDMQESAAELVASVVVAALAK
ncbi:MAG TPA: site-specific integrase [Coriobacteriia bacterium]|nr:site-specific integrase [Coriobacteriia bacterium]